MTKGEKRNKSVLYLIKEIIRLKFRLKFNRHFEQRKMYNGKDNKKVFLSNTISEALSCINNNSPTSTHDQIVNMNHSINPGFQSNTPVSYQRGIIQ